MVNPEFKAIYNIFTRQLAVAYGDTTSLYTFKDQVEWTKISFNGNQDHPNYLHVQLDYDETAQLLFYPREDGDQYLHEDLGTYFNSGFMDELPEKIKLIYNDIQWEKELDELLAIANNMVTVPYGL